MTNLRYHVEELKALSDTDFITITALIDSLHEKYKISVSKDRLKKIISEANKHVFVIKARSDENPNERIVAMVLFSFNKTICLNKVSLTELVVLPKYRHQGLARVLFKYCIDQCIAYEADIVELVVHRDNSEAIALYKTFGVDYSNYDYMRLILRPWMQDETINID